MVEAIEVMCTIVGAQSLQGSHTEEHRGRAVGSGG